MSIVPINFQDQVLTALPLIRKLKFLDFSLTFHWPLKSFPWPFINEKQSMFTFALAFLQAINIFLFIFNLLPEEGFGRKHPQQKPLTTTTTCVRRRVSYWSLCLLYSILFIFSKRKCISKSCRKLKDFNWLWQCQSF